MNTKAWLLLHLTVAVVYSCTSAPRYYTTKPDETPVEGRYASGNIVEKDLPSSGEEFGEGKTYNWTSSFYGAKFHGNRTANGEIYDMRGMTCAHRELPFGTLLEVTNPDNNRKVTVRVNDRGPFIRGRDLDISYAAAQRIGMIDDGVKELQVKIIKLDE